MREATLERNEHDGLGPTSAGWFVLNLGDCQWLHSERFGTFARLEGADDARFDEIGVNVHVLQPDQPACHYHREDAQEDFLVLFGECKVIIEDEERLLKAWDFVHCPPGATHVFVGAGTGPCAILMLGRRGEDIGITYPVSELALAHGAGVKVETDSPAESYKDVPRPQPGPNPWAGYLAQL